MIFEVITYDPADSNQFIVIGIPIYTEYDISIFPETKQIYIVDQLNQYMQDGTLQFENEPVTFQSTDKQTLQFLNSFFSDVQFSTFIEKVNKFIARR